MSGAVLGHRGIAPAPGSLAWFAAHDLRLAFRDWLAMVTAGRSARGVAALAVTLIAIAGLHALAYAVLAPAVAHGVAPTQPVLLLITGLLVLGFSLMLSQALESVTRVLYSRGDLELILSSPARHEALFAVRIGAIVVTTALLSGGLAAPFLNVAIWLEGPHWIAGYAVLIAAAAVATAAATAITFGLFAVIGPRRTRLVAQIVAAVIGATFLIGTQIAAIQWYGTISRLALFEDARILAMAPAADSITYLPARAVLGDAVSLFVFVAVAACLLAAAITWSSRRLGEAAHAAASVGLEAEASATVRPLAAGSPTQALRAKEFRLLARDPWLVSQTLMQTLYLIPPAVLLWQSQGAGLGASVLIVPVFVMAIGQLAGGLAWLAISGEDAADLVATAPVPPHAIMAAKIQSVMAVLIAIAVPAAIGVATLNLWAGAMALAAMLAAAASAITIQLLFRVSARRAQFRRRQTASRVATFSEAFSSILWAATGGLMAAGTWLALPVMALALGVIGLAWLLSPARGER